MTEEYKIDQLCFCRDYEFCNGSLNEFSRCRNLDNAIKYYPIIKSFTEIYNSIQTKEDLQSIKLPNIDLNIKLQKELDFQEFKNRLILFINFTANLQNSIYKNYPLKIVQALSHVVIFNIYLNNFNYLIEIKKLYRAMYEKINEYLNKENVYEYFSDISKLYNLDQNILLIYKNLLEPHKNLLEDFK